MIESILKLSGYTADDIDIFACSEGPGSFTGIRIGAATIKGLAFGQNKNCLGVSTLEALAENLVPFDGIICPVMNARRGQVYNALFRYENGALVRLCEDRALSVTELAAELAEKGLPFALCGDGVTEFKRLAPDFAPTSVSALLEDQSAVSVAKVALRLANAGVSGTDAELVPVYLRMPQAERERLEKLKQ
jgi:tRNA threonylcarbamoyladenosine biosynthesis protein TsaB